MSAPSARALAGRGAVVSLVGAGHCYSHMASVALAPLFPVLHEALGVGYAALGALAGVFAIASGAGQIPLGILVDRFGGRAVLVPGIACLGAAFVLAGLLGGYWPLFAAMAVAGLANSVFHPADYAILADRVDEAFLGRAMGIHAFVGYVGWAIAPAFMLALDAAFGWRGALAGLGILGIGVAATVGLRGAALAPAARRTAPARRGRRGVAAMIGGAVSAPGAPALLSLFLYFFLTAVTVGGMAAFAAVAAMELFGVDRASGNFALTVYLAAMAAGVLAGGAAADRVADHNRLVALAIAGGAAGIAVAAAGWGGFPGALLAIGASGLLVGVASPSRDLLVRAAAPPGGIGLAFGFTATGMSVGFAAGPPAVGWLMDLGRPDLGLLMLAAVSLCAVATVSGLRPNRR